MFRGLILSTCLFLCVPAADRAQTTKSFAQYKLDFDSPVDADLQKKLLAIDESLRSKFKMTPEQTAVGVLDLQTCRLALIHPDREEYAASLAKVGILLAYFQLHPQAAAKIDSAVEHELGLMAKASSNEMASKYSHELSLAKIQEVLDQYHFYDKEHGGGIWCGKHYGKDPQRRGSPVADNSHAATVRQMMRYFLLLEQGKLVSPEASKEMRHVFESPDIPADDIKFVKGLGGREVKIIRKWGTWEDWRHDAAVVSGKDRHYIIVALTKHPKGDEYLESLAPAVDDVMRRGG